MLRCSPRCLLILTLLFVLIYSSFTAAYAQSQPSPHIDSLRQALQLPAAVRLHWPAGRNGVDTISVIDDFNRAEIGEHWTYDKRYWRIKDGELTHTPEAIYGWRYLALFNPVYNKPGRRLHSVSYRWGQHADSIGIKEGAHALMIDTLSTTGSGYWLWHRTNYHQVWLWIVRYGTWEYTWGQGKSVDQKPANVRNPVAGDVVTAVIRQRNAANYFDYFVNDSLDATCADSSKEFGEYEKWYVGVFIHGENLNNAVDDFTVTWLENDKIAPGAVSDLRGADSSSSSITLAWSAPGDNNWDGQAHRYDIRYSTEPITANNFSAAAAAPPPAPKRAGETQTLVINGLQIYQTYYVAMRAYDEVGHVSALSNVLKIRTKGDGIGQQLALAGGCDQTGDVGKPLAQPLVAQVTDRFGAPVSGFAVQFAIVSGHGHLQGDSTRTVTTDANGRAQTAWTLGTLPGRHEVEIRANGLSGSPIRCQATAKIGAAAKINLVSGNGQIVSAGKASAPVVVRVLDALDNPVAVEPVKFSIVAGSGWFSGKTKTFETTTANDGTAAASCFAGEIYGDTTKIEIQSGQNPGLNARFNLITAAPDSLAEISGNHQTGQSGATLPEPLVVRVFDEQGAPAKNFGVTFRVVAGGGSFANDTTQIRVLTDSSGYAAAFWRLGQNLSSQQANVKAEFNGAKLRQSPISYFATATPATISPTLSRVTAASGASFPADSAAEAAITITLRDEFGQPVAGKQVHIQVSGQGNFITQPDAPTNANGRATAKLRSMHAGIKTVSAYVVSPALKLADSLRLTFTPLPATTFEIAGGNNQSGITNEPLNEPVVAVLRDKLGHPPAATEVQFTVVAGGGSLLSNAIVVSDSNGLVQAVWRMGPGVGINRLEAHAANAELPVLSFNALALVTGVTEKSSGNLPLQFILRQNSPNPFNPETNIQFDLPEAALVRLELYDLNGRLVRMVLEGERPAGTHTVRWNGRDQANQVVNSGVYVYRLRAHSRHSGEFTATRKLILMK
ncbi:Ig-like domain-containing protein [bacterium]|nr:Ig-like domain-containing protein [bacterium]